MAGQEQVVVGRERVLVGAMRSPGGQLPRLGQHVACGSPMLHHVDEVAVADRVPPTGATSRKESTDEVVQATPSDVNEER